MWTLLLITTGVIITNWVSPANKLWPTIISQTSIAFLISLLKLIPTENLSSWNTAFHTDNISSPLLILSFWLLPVSLLSSVSHLNKKSNKNTQLFITLSLLILLSLTITFSSSNLMLFFIGFEGTLIPTLFLISQWGMQEARIEAGYYFIFYTLISSLPLLLGLISIYNTQSHLNINYFTHSPFNQYNTLIPIFCLIAFLVKVPIFGLHLWLPKAHVEAPVAGSMILAAILLKMGGYGFIRLSHIFIESVNNTISPLLIPFCCWGGALTSLICITQTDLKSLIAYSSVSHMSFMIGALAYPSAWGVSGGVIVMIAHGLVSSGLFCIANLFYERSGSRTLSINRGLKNICTTLPIAWLLLACANLGLPPLPNSVGELMVFSSIITNSLPNFIPSIIGILFTGIFSLTIYQLLNSGSRFNWNIILLANTEREILTLFLHITPLFILTLNLNLIIP
uniref:NADH-ubiquinone oxidoreductase chain 4 n=1 Tax=Amphiura sp. JN-2020 TaxID=2763518 RepID=A0A7H0R1L6_9ECHI|nr:NADH dehydrogenase subunit 4 [Amphiura sp. JN-2020]